MTQGVQVHKPMFVKRHKLQGIIVGIYIKFNTMRNTEDSTPQRLQIAQTPPLWQETNGALRLEEQDCNGGSS